ncbi:MAG: LacI family transcriptional regulator [Anaerolineae bacterium]|nr:LacI family transcriptional regulator [Anaerolineae bacterium]
MSKKTTIVDIARTAGVSVSTVSRILNNKPDVAEETRQRVLRVIEDERFAPHITWQQLRTGKSRFIALHFPQDFNPPSQGIITNAALRCESAGYTLNLIVGPLDENELLTIFNSGQADAIVLVEILTHDWRVEVLREHDINFVMVGRCADTDGLSYVDSDIGAGVKDAMSHLVELGHRHIGFITLGEITPEKEYGFTAWARQGYKDSCLHHDLPLLWRTADLSNESVAAVTFDLLSQHPEITAVVTPQDSGVPGILKAIASKGLRIPDDISIVGLLDESVAEMMTPPLTALSFTSRELGFIAVDMLIAQLTGAETEPQQVLVGSTLQVRGSTGPARVTVPASLR